jgi:hypothetical protein
MSRRALYPVRIELKVPISRKRIQPCKGVDPASKMQINNARIANVQVTVSVSEGFRGDYPGVGGFFLEFR